VPRLRPGRESKSTTSAFSALLLYFVLFEICFVSFATDSDGVLSGMNSEWSVDVPVSSSSSLPASDRCLSADPRLTSTRRLVDDVSISL